MPDGTVGFTCTYQGEEKDFSVVQMTAMLLAKLKETTESELKTKVTDCVIGVPFYFNDRQRHALLSAAKIAGLNCLKLINETAATALAYGIYKQDLPADGAKPRTVVFCDVGHSQTQLSCCEFIKGKLTVVATSHASVGGRDFDRKLFHHFAEEFKGKYKIDVYTKARAAIRLEAECEKVKKLMSANSTPCTLNLECLMDDKDVAGVMKREDFEVLVADVLEQIKACATQLLEKCKIEKEGKFSAEDIDFVEVVGASSRVPSIKKIFSEAFNKELNTTLNLDEAVSRGCALQAAISSPTFRVRDFAVVDKTPYAIDLSWKSVLEDEESSAAVFKENGTAHLTKVLTFYRSENFDLAASYHTPEVVPGNISEIAAYTIEGVKVGADGESPKIKVKVKLDEHGCFKASEASMIEKVAPQPEEEEKPEKMDTDSPKKDEEKPAEGDDKKDPKEPEDGKKDEEKKAEEKEPSKKKAKTTKTTLLTVVKKQEYVLSDDQLNTLIEAENELASNDRAEKEKSNAKNSLEEFIYNMRDKISTNLEEFMEEAKRDEYRSNLTKMEDWLYEDGEDEQKSVYVAKLGELKNVSDPVEARYKEFEGRAAAIERLQQSVVACRRFLEQQAGGEDRYKHLSEEDMTKVKDQFTKTETFLNSSVPALQALKKHEDPVVTCAQLVSEKEKLDKCYIPVMTKSAPKEEPPKDESAAENKEGEQGEGEKKDEEKKEGDDEKKEEKPTAEGENAASSMEVD
jgi:molecular chaperone DnaK (HSP70)